MTERGRLVVNQVLHGYRDGHRLLAKSTSLDPDAVRRVDRLSDASGQQPVPDNDGYITGYPLPNGEYALAKTWYDLSALRPNAVWTHTLILGKAALAIPGIPRLASALRRPTPNEIEQYREPLLVETQELAELPLAGAGHSIALGILRDLYGPKVGVAVGELKGLEDRNQMVLAIWAQQWPRLRRGFAFCAGALEPRSVAPRVPFDLLLGPPSAHLLRWGNSSPWLADENVVRALAEDLQRPGGLRELLWSVGADTGQRRLAAVLVAACVAAQADPPEPATALESVTAVAPAPGAMRRIKRELLRSPGPLLLAADPIQVLDELASEPGDSVLVDDASVSDWARRGWEANRTETLNLLSRVGLRNRPTGSAAAEEPLGTTDPEDGCEAPAVEDDLNRTPPVVTARQALTTELEAFVAAHSRPEDLSFLATHASAVAIAAIASSAEPERWWKAWTLLPDHQFQGLSAGLVALDSQKAANALTDADDGAGRWLRLLNGREPDMVLQLLIALGSRQDIPETWEDALAGNGELVLRALTEGTPAEALATAANLAARMPRLQRLPWELWQPLAAESDRWIDNSVRTAVIFVVASQARSQESDAPFRIAYESLYKRLAVEDASRAWSIVTAAYKDSNGDWDRCDQLARIAYRQAAKRGDRGAELVATIRDPNARTALLQLAHAAEEHASKEKPRKPWDVFLDLVREW
jgi:hypothetical protein